MRPAPERSTRVLVVDLARASPARLEGRCPRSGLLVVYEGSGGRELIVRTRDGEPIPAGACVVEEELWERGDDCPYPRPHEASAFLDAGYVWAPYVPLQVTPRIDVGDLFERFGSRMQREVDRSLFASLEIAAPPPSPIVAPTADEARMIVDPPREGPRIREATLPVGLLGPDGEPIRSATFREPSARELRDLARRRPCLALTIRRATPAEVLSARRGA